MLVIDRGYASAWPAPTQQGKGSSWLPVWVPQCRQLVAYTLGRKGQWLVLRCGTFSSSDGSPRAHPWEGGGRDLHLFTGCLAVAVVCSCLWSLRQQQWLASAPVGSRWCPAAYEHTEEDAPLCIDVERSPIYSKLKKKSAEKTTFSMLPFLWNICRRNESTHACIHIYI